MFTKEKALKISVVTLAIIACLDLLRGFMHTFNIWWASENVAHMTQTADTMQLMNSFGITNILTGFIFILIIIKAKELSPYVLIIITFSYVLGIISLNTTGVAAMMTTATEWNGKYFMFVYLTVIMLIGINYFVSTLREKYILKA